MLTESNNIDINFIAPNFELLNVDKNFIGLNNIKDRQ